MLNVVCRQQGATNRNTWRREPGFRVGGDVDSNYPLIHRYFWWLGDFEMKLKVGFAAIVLIGSMGAAFAADLPARNYTKAPVVPMEPPCMWCGFYIGIQGGGAWGNESFTDNLGGVP